MCNYALVSEAFLRYNYVFIGEYMKVFIKQDMLHLFEVQEASVQATKKVFETFITSKELSLEDRWDLFCGAPNYLKNREPRIARFAALGSNFCYYEEYGTERYQVVYTTGIVEFMEDNEYPSVQIQDLKEEILAKNLGSFTFDW